MLVWACALLAVLAGCRERPRASLLDLSEVEPEGEATFVVHGRGFPTDREAEVELDGVVHRPGEGPRAVTATLPGAASSAEHLAFSIDGHPELSALSPGQFEGRLTIAFAAGAAEIRGRLEHVRLPLRSGRADARRDALHAARRGTEWLASLGASELELDLERAGVRVGRVEPEGVAELAGLAPGDRIVALDAAVVGDLADLWPAPAAEPVRLTVERGAASRQVEVSLPRARGQRVRAEPRDEWVGALAIALLGLLLVAPARLRCARGGTPDRLAPLGAALLAAPIAVAGSALQLGEGALHVLRGVVPAALVMALLPLLGPRRLRLEAATRAGVQLSVAFVALATAGLLCGTLSPSLAAAGGQGDWPLLLQPPGWCLLAMVHLALRAPARAAHLRGIAAGARGTLTFALVALLGGCEVWPALGGVAGQSLVASLAWLAFEWMVARRVFSFAALGLAALLGPAASVAWFLGEPGQSVAATFSALTPWLAAGLCLRAAVVRGREVLWPAPSFDPRLAPFL